MWEEEGDLLAYSVTQLINDGGDCRAAPGFATGSAKKTPCKKQMKSEMQYIIVMVLKSLGKTELEWQFH